MATTSDIFTTTLGLSHATGTATTTLQGQPQSSAGSLTTPSSTRDVAATANASQAFAALFSQLVASQGQAAAASIEADRATDMRIAALEEIVKEQHKTITALQQSLLAQKSAHEAAEELRRKERDDLMDKLTLFEHRFVNHFHGPYPVQPPGTTTITLTAEEARNRRPNIGKTKASDATKAIVYEVGRAFPEMDLSAYHWDCPEIPHSEDHEI